ncbi:F0F1 ATP synthase subunit B [Pseudomonas fluvialis]|uniref:ATP synthase subunit b n=1 Tax=Pseudomonas fluvialis TaxID=1793966 RepID=A0A2I0CN51_9PSED|nr:MULTISPECIES: F0F1 ATP synthase subunit B [Pseudomonas]MBP8262195.1 F0F1 ATP synthase subunit B [Pseudomonas sp.]TXH36678.1 MAG: F0F1 ATP synthase subunit B [Burkholderiaceae bacterium]OXM41032.1 F0F1 ATP synthase subunit B [Pseudomonas fluvialis]PKF70565.1 F0F1 ATP synthase subunit B [Pseudomonas pharmacofabricae]GGH96231.1 ATP synthase subunit b [Pseudomonas fluvialis]
MNINLTLFGQTFAFAIFVWFCMKFVWPPITKAMQERQKKIAEGLDAAGRAQQDLKLAQEKVTNTLRETKEQATQILEQANKHASAIVEEAKQQARAEGERLVNAARAEIEQEVNRAKDQLRAQVAALAVLGAEKILESQVDAKVHNDLVEKLASQL